MQTFWDWLRLRRLLEAAWYTFDAKQYDQLFDSELEKVITRVKDPAHRQALEHLRGFDWIAYISSWVRHAGFHDRREVQERAHDVVTKLLLGTLFRGYDPRIHGPMELRFKCAVGNAIRNMIQKERTRKRRLPTTSIAQEFTPGSVTADDLPAKPARDDDSKVIDGFRELVRRRLGSLGLAVLDARLDREETQSLVGCASLGSPSRWVIKKVVQDVKRLAREYAASLGDPELLRRVERAMAGESETVGKRRAMAAARQKVGAGA